MSDRTCKWCGEVLPAEMRSHALYCSPKCRKDAHKAEPCTYCGVPADSRDHFIPRAYLQTMQDIESPLAKRQLLLPACRECNSIAGKKVFDTIAEKRAYIHERLSKKYRKLIEAPAWTDAEIVELGSGLATYVRYAQKARETIIARLKWKKSAAERLSIRRKKTPEPSGKSSKISLSTGICKTCERRFKLDDNGYVSSHRPLPNGPAVDGYCYGSGLPPKYH